jgi:putative membrane-bound dehydrogenase-like protein
MAAANRPAAKEEPYTWTRQYGKGRVFYTAYGHDERTWSQPGFQQLLERGILWAVGDKVKQQHDALNPKPFAYHEAKLPNYEKRPGAQMQQEPLSPEESMKHIQVPVDFTLDLFAHEPNVMHPIALAWDERGRLYALITKDYPNERKPEGGSDYIVICEDTNNDGKADKFTNFAEGLSIPTGMVFANGGLYVSQAPHMLFLQDTNGDDKADSKKILFTGFGTFDTHAGPSNLHYGFDNWIWGSVGYAGFKGKIGPDSVKFSQGFFRFKPDGSQLEHVTNTSNNTWGLAFSETGDVFGSTANNAHGWYMAIPNRYFHGGAHLRENGSRGTDTHKDMKPITERVRQVDVFGGFTAAAGHNFYTARAFPKEYWNKIAFVAEPTGHILHQNLMRKNGTDYEDNETIGTGFNLMAGADEWFAPVFAEVGPDGAVWVVDWYSFIIQHNPTPKGATNGSGNAYETPLRDFTHGRIYRVGYSKAPAYSPLSLSKARPAELVAALKNDNMFWRMTAQRLLVERGNKDVVPELLQIVANPAPDKLGINPASIHALRVLEGLNSLGDPGVFPVLQLALRHPDAHVRKTVAQVLPRNQQSSSALLQADLLADKEPLVVLNTLLALSEMPQSAAAQKAILARLNNATELDDRWLPEAFACALAGQDGQLMKTYLKQVSMATPAGTQPAHDMNSHAMPKSGKGGPNAPEPSAQLPKPESGHLTAGNHSNAPQPDLLIAAIRTTPESPAVREGTKIYVDVTNAGGVAIPAGTPIPLSLRIEGPNNVSDRNNLAQSKIDYVSVAHDTGIKPGETVTISKGNNGPWSTDFNVQFERAGQYTITAMLDRDNKIVEENEQNNNKTHLLTYRPPATMSAYVLERAMRSYASVAPVDSIVALLRQTKSMDATRSAAIVKGISEGWNMKQKATIRDADKSFLASLTGSVSPDNRDRLNRLYEAWGLVKNETANAGSQGSNVEVVRMKTVREEMRFDKKEFTVTAGKQVEIVLENPDAMQHNLVIGKPKSIDIIGTAADKMITAKDGAEKNYVPSLPQVIAATPLVNPDQTYRLTFTAPAVPGDYPFVCTFPGHWRIMNGIMKVTKANSIVVAK